MRNEELRKEFRQMATGDAVILKGLRRRPFLAARLAAILADAAPGFLPMVHHVGDVCIIIKQRAHLPHPV